MRARCHTSSAPPFKSARYCGVHYCSHSCVSSHDGHKSCKQGLHTIAIRVFVTSESIGSASCDSKADGWSEWSEGLQVNAETPRMPKRPSTSSSGSSILHPHLPKDYFRFLFLFLPVAHQIIFRDFTPAREPEVSMSCLMQAKGEIDERDTQTARCIGLAVAVMPGIRAEWVFNTDRRASVGQVGHRHTHMELMTETLIFY
jgi:hypothetical protein